jgi:hypothetical protein
MVVFDDKVAALRGLNAAVLVITDRNQADMLRGLFEMIWAQLPALGADLGVDGGFTREREQKQG